MRMRNKPWARPELNVSELFVDEPENNKGKWKSQFENVNLPLHIELGCGKGGFISQLAFLNPSINYLAIDKQSNMLGLANRKIKAEFAKDNRKINNILLAACDIERIFLILSQNDKASRIYINFCNPWYKNKDKKKRLTHSRQLEKYKVFLEQGGEIWFKTDDDDLFADSLTYFEETGFKIRYITYDLHTSGFLQNVVTEHEEMFSKEGIKIKFLIAVL
ncbi:MAG: tRNA (guanosine(46)-N7)-methyltransferase TrmB [Oscillospiraceae bacterium]